MIDEKRLKARMAALLKGIEKELPVMCKEIGARQRDMTVTLASTFMTIVKMVDDLAEKGCWIPCSERLPDNPKQVLICVKFVADWGKDYDINLGEYWDGADGWGIEGGEVIAWMPLPEPYKEGDKGWQDLT